MHVRWFGQSAFSLRAGNTTVFIDPFGAVDSLGARGMRWEYPPIDGVSADLLLVTHEHVDHNGVEAIDGAPRTIRSIAGTFDSPAGALTAIASEHDDVAGTLRGPNTIFAFGLEGLRVCHFGDFGQADLRPEQRRAIGDVDLLFLPVGGMATIGGDAAAAIVRGLSPRWVVPMHYRTPAIGFLEPIDGFLTAMGAVETVRLPGPAFETDDLPAGVGPAIVLPEPSHAG